MPNLQKILLTIIIACISVILSGVYQSVMRMILLQLIFVLPPAFFVYLEQFSVVSSLLLIAIYYAAVVILIWCVIWRNRLKPLQDFGEIGVTKSSVIRQVNKEKGFE